MAASISTQDINSLVVQSKGKAIHFCVGPHPKGPKKCLACGETFKVGEVWKRMISPPDPIFGSYSIGIHERCLPPEMKIV